MKRSKGLKCSTEVVGRTTAPAKGQPAPSRRVGAPNKTPTGDAEYWQFRAERTRSEARRYKQDGIRDHFIKIAAGYYELARRDEGRLKESA